jgi:hypothetical protein
MCASEKKSAGPDAGPSRVWIIEDHLSIRLSGSQKLGQVEC